jgi:hypothetical protein
MTARLPALPDPIPWGFVVHGNPPALPGGLSDSRLKSDA